MALIDQRGEVSSGPMSVAARRPASFLGWAALGVGVGLVAVGVGMVPYLIDEGVALGSLVALVALGGGAALLGWGMRHAVAGRRARFGLGTGVAVLILVAVAVVAPAVAATHVPATRIDATPGSIGLDAISVSLRSEDGVRLAGWYVPSANGAAVIVRHGAGSTRSAVLDQAVVLAEAGFGVLMMDARGHGDSGGAAMDLGWWGTADIVGGLDFLEAQPGVDPARLGVVGLSMGGEEAIGAAGSDDRVRAVVAEGATARTAADRAWLPAVYGWRGSVQQRLDRVRFGLTDLLTPTAVPRSLRDALAAAGDTPALLIAAGTVPDETHAARYIAEGAPGRVEVWTVPGAGHVGALGADPEGWRARVVGFLDDQLAPTG